jgi:hypothetical protein
MQTFINPRRNEYGGRDDMPGTMQHNQMEGIQGSYYRQDPMISLCFKAYLLTFGGI